MGELRRSEGVTRAQRIEVRRLREQGWSIRGIAAEVFGSSRYRGRVERILARAAAGQGLDDRRGSREALEGLEPIEAIRLLFERRVAMLLAAEAAPSMTELRRLLEVARILDAQAQVERLRLSQRRRG